MNTLLKFLLIGLPLLTLFPASTSARTHVLLTVDTESYSNGDPQKQIWGEVDQSGELWGITKIMDIIEQNNGKATFYLNVYEAARHGEKPIRAAADEAIRRGHDVQLHTHPVVPFGVDKLSNAGLETQVEILSYGAALLKDWTGRDVIAHRAGAFRANMDTLRALKGLGIPVDSSLSIPLKTPIDAALGNRNEIVNLDGTIEFPLTFYTRIKLGGAEVRRTLDIESSTFSEIREVLDQAAAANLCSVNILMHSFSLSRYGAPDPEIASRLAQVMQYIDQHPDLEATTTSVLYDLITTDEACNNESAFVPHTGLMLTYLSAIEGFDRSTSNKLLVIAGAALPLVFLILLLLALARYRRHRLSERKSDRS